MYSPYPANFIPSSSQVVFESQYGGIEGFDYDVNHPFTFTPSSGIPLSDFTSLQVSSPSGPFSHDLQSTHPPSSVPSPATSDAATLVYSPSSTVCDALSPSPSRSPRKTTKAKRAPRKVGHKALARNDPDRIKRPLNAFMLFRKQFVAQRRDMLIMIEKDHRKLSEMAGQMWRDMTMEERRPWFATSKAEKEAHDQKYPDYKFTPVARDRKKRRTKRNGKAEVEKLQVLARMIREERPEEEIIATAMLHDYYIASLESGDECEARAVEAAEQQIDLSTVDVFGCEPDSSGPSFVGVTVDVETAAFTESIVPSDFTAAPIESTSWTYDVSLVRRFRLDISLSNFLIALQPTMDAAYPDYTDLSSGVFDIAPAPAHPLSMTTTQPLPGTSFYTVTPSYANEQQSYDLTTSASYCPELDLEGPDLEDYQNFLSQYDMQGFLYDSPDHYEPQAVATFMTASTVESSASRYLGQSQPYSGWDISN